MIRIEVAENGFITFESESPMQIGRQHVFESPETLANHIRNWGHEQEERMRENSSDTEE